MKITFFEVQDWETEELNKAFPDAVVTSEKLSETNAENFADSEIVSCFIYSELTSKCLSKFTNLKLIATRSTGFDHIDINYCHEKNIKVANVPEYGSNTVAEHTFALILNLTRKMYQSINQSKTLKFVHNEIRGVDLFGKTIGIVGLGKIGINVLKIAKGFGMNALVYDGRKDEKLAESMGFQYSDLDNLLKNADIISLHLPLTPKTKHLINKENIMMLKKGSYIVNTARGGLVDTEALVIALDKEILAGVGLDVLEGEKDLSEEAALLNLEYIHKADLKTLVFNHILINNPKVLITPHNAFNSVEALMRITMTTIDNIKSFTNNSPKNLL